jgi:hypothetical protein
LLGDCETAGGERESGSGKGDDSCIAHAPFFRARPNEQTRLLDGQAERPVGGRDP